MSRKSVRARLLYCALSLLVVAGCDSGSTATPTTAPPGNATSTVVAPANTDAATATVGAPETVAPTADDANLSGEVTFLVFGEPAEAKAFVDVGKAFEAKYPNVKIKTTAVPS
ncbi:MAG: hypothetical protein M3328_05475, partial [Chloroflexota bacterium]|nr:hypothetical protein [Chloroflexota bacterium]